MNDEEVLHMVEEADLNNLDEKHGYLKGLQDAGVINVKQAAKIYGILTSERERF